jgi:hypothetical protein
MRSTMRLGGTIGAMALRPVSGAVALGLGAEREARRAVAQRLSDTALTILDGAMRSRIAGEAVDRVVDSALTRRALSGLLEGSLVEAAGRDVVRYAVVERVADVILAGDALEQAVARFLEGPEIARVAEAALESEAMERLVGRVVDSRLLDEVVDRLLESEDLWHLVDEIAHSPEVTDAIASQSMGFADQVAGGVRVRTRRADAWLEQRVRRLRRKPPAAISSDGSTSPTSP